MKGISKFFGQVQRLLNTKSHHDVHYFLLARQTYTILVFIQVSVKLLTAVYGSIGIVIDNGRKTHSDLALYIFWGSCIFKNYF